MFFKSIDSHSMWMQLGGIRHGYPPASAPFGRTNASTAGGFGLALKAGRAGPKAFRLPRAAKTVQDTAGT